MFKVVWTLHCKTMLEKWKKIARDADSVFKDVHKNDWIVETDDPLVRASIFAYDQVHKWSTRYSKVLFGTDKYWKHFEES